MNLKIFHTLSGYVLKYKKIPSITMGKKIIAFFVHRNLYILILIIVTSISLLIIPKTFAINNYEHFLKIKKINLINQNSYKYIAGIIQNIGNKTVNHIIITANILDKNHKSIGNFSKESDVTALNPKNESPFDILIYNRQVYNLLKTYELNIKFNFTTVKDEKLHLTSNYSYLDSSGFYFINGKLQNLGTLYSNNTTVTAITFGKNKSLSGIWKAQSEPYNIPPYGFASFSIPITDKNQSFQIGNYTLFAESDKYTLK